MNVTLVMVAQQIRAGREGVLSIHADGKLSPFETGCVNQLNWLVKDIAKFLERAEGHEFMLACGLSQEAADQTLGKL